MTSIFSYENILLIIEIDISLTIYLEIRHLLYVFINT
jgi:hypothetical protein